MKAYGITAKEPSPQFPGVASFVQALGPKLEILYWHALLAPGGDAGADRRQAERHVAGRRWPIRRC